MEIKEILKSFEICDKEYKRKAIDAALARREEIIPHLISVLEKVLHSPEKFAERDSDYFAHIYAFMLLGHFSETKAHDVIVDLFSLPNHLSSDLFGGSVTEDLPIVLFRTYGGNTRRIKDLILNKNAIVMPRPAGDNSRYVIQRDGKGGKARVSIVSTGVALFCHQRPPCRLANASL